MAPFEYQPRVVDAEFRDRLGGVGALVIEGLRTCGKTATASQVAASEVLLDIDRQATDARFEIRLGEHGVLTAVPAPGAERTLIDPLLAAALDPSVAGTWRHFKGGAYEFLARVVGTDGELVLYRDRSGGCWLRPWAMVGEFVERDGASRPRFVRVTG